MKNLIKFSLLILFVLLSACSNDDDSSTVGILESSNADVLNAINANVVGTSTLERRDNYISAKYTTTDLTPNYAYTLWWVIWNKPENCASPNQCIDSDLPNAANVEVELLYGSGLVADSSGQGTFTAQLFMDDNSESINSLFDLPSFGGLQDTMAAEVHLVLRSHGPVIPGQEAEQIGTYQGGCAIFFDPFTEIPDEEGECGDIEFSIHAPVL